ncbi:MAG: hypothetical protein ACTSVI_07145 [Promethearchaeota archaeon]
MKIKELKPNTNADVKVRVCAQGPVRKVNSKKGYSLHVCSFQVGDETGVLSFSAFGKDISALEKVVGKVVEFKNIWVKEYNGELQLSKGRSGEWLAVNDPDFPLTSEILKDSE